MLELLILRVSGVPLRVSGVPLRVLVLDYAKSTYNSFKNSV